MSAHARLGKSHKPGSKELLTSVPSSFRSTLGLVAPFSSDIVESPYLGDLIAGITKELLPTECQLQWFMIRDKYLETYDFKLLKNHPSKAGGFLVLSWRHFPKLIKQMEVQSDYPIVLINDFDPSVKLSNVYCENQSGAQKIWNHFMEKGYKSIGMIRGPERVSNDARERFEAFNQCAQDAGKPLDENFLYESDRFDEEAGYHVMRFWLKKGNLPEAIFCANDDLARGSILALKESNLVVPTDVAIAGFDDSQGNLMVDPPLTTVRQPLKEMGAAAVQTLIKLIQEKEHAPSHVKFSPELIVRESA